MSDTIEVKYIKAYVQENGIIRIDNVANGKRNLIGRLCDDVTYSDIPEYKDNLSDAVKLLTKAIKEDPDFKLGYIANIAMAFVDECEGASGFENVSFDTLHEAANKAAERFLDNWCR